MMATKDNETRTENNGFTVANAYRNLVLFLRGGINTKSFTKLE